MRVKKDWYVGLAPDHVDHEHPDINAPIVDHTAGEVTQAEIVKSRNSDSRDGGDLAMIWNGF